MTFEPPTAGNDPLRPSDLPADSPPAQQPSTPQNPYAQNPYAQPAPSQQPQSSAYPYGQQAPPPPTHGGYAAAPVPGAGPVPGSPAYITAHFGPLASFGDRAIALIIDGVLGMIAALPALIGAVLLVVGAPRSEGFDEFGNPTFGDANTTLMGLGGILLVVGFISSIAFALWNRVFRMGNKGQSLGKKYVGLHLINDKTGQPIGAGQCFLREVLNGLVNQVVYLGYLWMLWDDNKQTLGDKVASSNVIKLPKTAAR